MAFLRRVPSPTDQPKITAKQLCAHVKKNDGRLYRMREFCVFVVTTNEKLAQWLLLQGASPYVPAGSHVRRGEMRGAYRDSKKGPWKWDLYIHHIPVKGEQTVWEAAGLADAELYEVA